MTDAQPYTVQVVVDCADPHPLADWWAEALGWEVEPQDEDFIRSMVDQGFATDADTTTHHGALVWAAAVAINHPEGRPGAADPVPAGPRAQDRQEPRPPRPPHHRRPSLAERDRLLALGATEIGSGTEGPLTAWVVLTDPEGNELCLPVPPPAELTHMSTPMNSRVAARRSPAARAPRRRPRAPRSRRRGSAGYFPSGPGDEHRPVGVDRPEAERRPAWSVPAPGPGPGSPSVDRSRLDQSRTYFPSKVSVASIAPCTSR